MKDCAPTNTHHADRPHARFVAARFVAASALFAVPGAPYASSKTDAGKGIYSTDIFLRGQ